jgi:hypothetical protein
MTCETDEQAVAPTTKRCDVCGQVFDTRDQDQVFHHDTEPHEPLAVR